MAQRRLRGAKLKGGAEVPNKTQTPAVFGVMWDSDGYFRSDTDNRILTIPTPKRRGRYQIRVAVRWMNPWTQNYDPPPTYEDFVSMYYYTHVTINDQLLGNDARATANPVLAASGTTQYFAVDANLGVGDSVGVKLWQSMGHSVQAFVFLEIRRLGPRVGTPTFVIADGGPDPVEDNG